MSVPSLEQTIIDLQIQMMEQERVIETLSQQLLFHGEQVDRLKNRIQMLETKLAEREDSSPSSVKSALSEDQKPPHY